MEMMMNSMKTRTTLLLNWYANPYHAPILVAKALGYYKEEEINLAILETTDPSDVTEIVGLGKVDIGLKAMIHTIAARTKGYPVHSIGTLLDEPPTGIIALKSSGIAKFSDIVGKRIGYIGEFGKLMLEDLASLAGIDKTTFTSIRVGMHMTDAIKRNVVDAGIGFSNFQQLELEEFGETIMLRLDQLAGLGCCCFCSIQFIVHENVIQQNGDLLKRFMRATQRGTSFTIENPEKAFEIICISKPQLRTKLFEKIFTRTLPYFSRNLLNVDRDWNKVASYSKHLGIVSENFEVSNIYTNQYIPETPYSDIEPLACCLA